MRKRSRSKLGATGLVVAYQVACTATCLPRAAAAATNADSVTLVPSSVDLPPQITANEFRAALQTAAMRWSYPEVACTRLALQVAAAEPRRQVANDGRNLFVFRKRRWCHNQQCGPTRTFPRLAAAMTTVYRGAATDGIAEADVELNALGFEWAVGAETRETKGRPVAPLVPVLVHEIGHQLGFEDACGSRHDGSVHADCDDDELESVMVSGSGREELSDFDVVRLCSRFPRNGAQSSSVSRSASHPVPPGWLAALALIILGAIIVHWRASRVRSKSP